jgi:hypothetical protein
MARLESPKAWRLWLAACVVFRLAIPLLALAFEGTALPGLPAYVYAPLYGDANGYYAGAREAVSAAGRAAPFLFAVVVGGAAIVLVARRRRAPSWILALLVGGWISLAATAVIVRMQPSGATVVGWPLVWALPLAPLRALDPDFGPDAAFVPGLVLSLAAIAVTCVAVAYVGARATGRRSVGAVAVALYALWPFIPGLVVGGEANGNGQWDVETGLHLYTEPLSTALVITAVALILRTPPTDLSLAIAGLSLGYATAVKITDATIALALFVVLLAFRRFRAAGLLAAGGLVFLVPIAAFWNKGYVEYYNGGVSVNPHPFGLRYVTAAWTDSILLTPTMLTVLLVPAIIGLMTLPRRIAQAVIGAPIVVTAILYSFYDVTPLHPRFFYVVLPLVLSLDAAAIVWIGSRLQRRSWHPRESARTH